MNNFSPNMIKTYLTCPKKYYFLYVENINVPKSALPFEKGKKIHALANYYLQKIKIERIETALTDTERRVWELLKQNPFYNKDYVNAIITENVMIPGISGKKINLDKSFNKMKKINKFNESLLIYDYIKPLISIKDNYNKIIVSGNKNINNVSIILNIHDKELFALLNKILINNNVKANLLVNNVININKTNFTNTVSYNYSDNIDYCITEGLSINKDCIINNRYTILVKFINNYHLTNTKNIINNGSILLYSFNKSNYNDLNIVIKYIRNNNYNIVSIDELLKE